MNLKKNRIVIFLLVLIIVILLITAGLMRSRNTVTTIPAAIPEPVKIEMKNNPISVVAKTPRKVKFESNDEIKKEYGKLETVTLWNGKSYTGAVINTDEVYSIITIDGLIKIPMKDVKVRDIIR